MKTKIIMLSEDTHIRTQLNKILGEMHIAPCEFFRTAEEFFRQKGSYSARNTIVILDDRFQYGEAIQICYKLQHRWPGIRMVVLFKKDNEISSTPIVNGSVVFLPKPMTVSGLEKALCVSSTIFEEEKEEDSLLKGSSDAMKKLRVQIRTIARFLSNTIITGETGSGKEVTIRELERQSGKKVVSVNCSSLNSTLAESDLFGHLKGSFTGSTTERLGYIKRADGGILFLDEIETLTSQAQANLLRFLDSGEYYTVGGDNLHKANVVVIAATNEPIDRLLAQGKLRMDFAMRLSVSRIDIPPLRDHLEDIPLLVRHREDQLGYSTHIKEMEAAYHYDWKGNVRELFNVVQRAHLKNPDNPVITEELL